MSFFDDFTKTISKVDPFGGGLLGGLGDGAQAAGGGLIDAAGQIGPDGLLDPVGSALGMPGPFGTFGPPGRGGGGGGGGGPGGGVGALFGGGGDLGGTSYGDSAKNRYGRPAPPTQPIFGHYVGENEVTRRTYDPPKLNVGPSLKRGANAGGWTGWS